MKRILGLVVCTALVAAAGSAAAEVKPSADADRTTIPEEYRWSLSALFGSAEGWEKALDGLGARLSEIGVCKGKLGKGAKETVQCLDTAYGLKQQLDALNAYAFQWWSVEMNLPKPQEVRERAISLTGRFEEAWSFFDPELREVEQTVWDDMAKKEQGLTKYGFYFKDLKRRQKHLLSPKEESLIALTLPMREGPYNVMEALAHEMDFPKFKDETGTETQLGLSVFPKFRASSDRRVRKEAVEGAFGTLFAYRTTLATSLATSVKGALFEAKARGYSSTLEMMLDADAVPVQVYDTLLSTTAENLPRTLHRYVALRKKILGLDAIHYYDLYNPLFPNFEKPVTYDAGVKMVEVALKPMGQDYVTIMLGGMKPGSGWTDVYPNKGKQSGAYCNAAYGTHPFVLLNYNNDLDDVFTLAHEFGHAMHFFLSHQAQPYPTADASIFLAEIASTFHEEMLLNDLLAKATSKDERLSLLNKRIENIRLTITRQTMFAEFEKLIHAEVESGGALTAERLSTIYRELIEKYFGPGFTIDENDPMEWAYIPHFYYNFYVYKYSTGLMSAIVFTQRVQEGKRGAVQQYKGLLTAGASDYPLVILEKAGIDFTQKEITQATYDLFARTLDEIESLL